MAKLWVASISLILTLALLNVQALEGRLDDTNLFLAPHKIAIAHADEAFSGENLKHDVYLYDHTKAVGPPGPPGPRGPRGLP